MRHDQSVERAVCYRHGCVRIGVFLGYHGQAQRANRSWTPASSRIGNTAKTCFILKHHPERLRPRPLTVD
jgi:hypothetical protein